MQENWNTEEREVNVSLLGGGNVTDFNSCVAEGHIGWPPEWTLWAIRSLLDISAECEMRIIYLLRDFFFGLWLHNPLKMREIILCNLC